MTPDVIEIAKALIACPSVTPKDEGAQEYLAKILGDAGFECHHLPFGEGDEEVPNLFARYGTKEPHICFIGHTDVVPPGPLDKWDTPPFEPTIKDDVLYGRGASDMKGGDAAFAAAAIDFVTNTPDFEGSISLLITGDEEGEAANGTIKVLEWMEANGHIPTVALGGEPTNPDHLGQEVKIGRRGSFHGNLTVHGKQGHVAYQHLANNPVPALAKLINALCEYEFDEGNEHFVASNLEFTTVDIGNPAENVIPGEAKAHFNIRYNDSWSAETLGEKCREILDAVGVEYELDIRADAESFLTQPGEWSSLVQDAVEEVTGKRPEATTTGGTSDARFVTNYCPVVECGPINATIHQVNENAKVSDLLDLTGIYSVILDRYFIG